MASHLTLKNTPPVVRDDEKAVEHSESQRRDGKEIHRGDGFPMIAQKSRPPLGRPRTPRRSPHPAQHGSLRKIEAKHFQFAVDAWCAPCGILRDHAKEISSRNSLLTHCPPALTHRRESHVQYSLNPARCQRTTVSGWTRINASFHSGQSCREITQKNLPEVRPAGEDTAASERQVAGEEPSSQAAGR